jgi:hypothetical protein
MCFFLVGAVKYAGIAVAMTDTEIFSTFADKMLT